MEIIKSLYGNYNIELYGFDYLVDYSHMMLWLRQGDNYCEFISNDIEREICRQTPGAILKSIRLLEKPKSKTSGVEEFNKMIADYFEISMNFELIILTKDDINWSLQIEYQYIIDSNSKNLRHNFILTNHRLII